MAPSDLLEELADLYSRHYGHWSANAPPPYRPGGQVKLSVKLLQGWLKTDSRISWAKIENQVIGYAISIQTNYGERGLISWVTQLVIHEDHRKRDVAKRLLFSIWGMSDHFAWGLLTANPYAVRALEKATRRRCDPKRIKRNALKLKAIGEKRTTYVKKNTAIQVNSKTSIIDTNFFLDHSELPDMLLNAQKNERWVLGELPEGWEWLAFTFHDQDEIRLTANEIEEMIKASDQVTKQAYSRMAVDGEHLWARHEDIETPQIVEWCGLSEGDTVLDVGCGTGRHAFLLAAAGMTVTGVDYIPRCIALAMERVTKDHLQRISFIEGDARNIDLRREFDALICLYDVVGSNADSDENGRILQNCVRHLRPGGKLLLSVMNFELTEHQAKSFFSLEVDSKALSELRPSKTMERTGNVFNPDHYLIDRDTKLVYRKEQFVEGNDLPVELIVRDRRYRRDEIEDFCRGAGLEVLWSRFVQSKHWDVGLDAHDERAKEILVLCQKPLP
ncbi:MAG TPA: class I SAM-dependent methyltransferase [Bryobacteraceae bacterium]|nr:class I SAM-dependent methyltransferase [Bryobacteraceae bacterium]